MFFPFPSAPKPAKSADFMSPLLPKPALLLIGPTGAGKSPLGTALEARDDWAHFDFGAHLRAIETGEEKHGLSDSDRRFVCELIASHALFPSDRFDIVAQILTDFLGKKADAPGVVLNGLPRTIDQAERIAPYLDVQRIVVLNCRPEVIAERILRRKQGLTSDHANRSDDTPPAIRKKVEIYQTQTAPLIEHYERAGIKKTVVPVETETTEENLVHAILK